MWARRSDLLPKILLSVSPARNWLPVLLTLHCQSGQHCSCPTPPHATSTDPLCLSSGQGQAYCVLWGGYPLQTGLLSTQCIDCGNSVGLHAATGVCSCLVDWECYSLEESFWIHVYLVLDTELFIITVAYKKLLYWTTSKRLLRWMCILYIPSHLYTGCSRGWR